jgi:hypothetical protein
MLIADTVLESVQNITSPTSTQNLSLANGTVFVVSLGASSPYTFTFSGATASVSNSFTVYLQQDATGGRTVTWPTVTWIGGTAPTINSAANAVSIFTFQSPDGGTTWYGAILEAPSLPITVSNGGTGVASTGAYEVVTGGTTSTGPLQAVSGTGTAGQALISAGASALPFWGSGPVSWCTSDDNLLAATFDPALSSSNLTVTGGATGGRLYLMRVNVRMATTLTYLYFITNGVGSGTNYGSFAGLYSSSYALLSGSSDISSLLTASTQIKVPLTTAQAVTPGAYYIGLLSNLSTNPSFRGASSNTQNADINLITGGSYLRTAASTSTTLTALPNPVTVGSTGTGELNIWAGAN